MTILICGLGGAGSHIASALVGSGVPPNAIAVVDRDEQQAHRARTLGFATVFGDASLASRLRVAGIGTASAVAIAVGDANAANVLRAVKAIQSDIRTYVLLHGPEHRRDIQNLGADAVVVVSEVGGQMLAEAVQWRSLRPGAVSPFA